MADYNPSGRTRAERDELRGETQVASRYPEYTPFERALASTNEELMELLLSKHNDYGPKNISDSPGGPLNGLRVRMHDKLARINNLIDKGVDPQHESLEDSFKDMANYAIIGLLVLRGQWDNE